MANDADRVRRQLSCYYRCVSQEERDELEPDELDPLEAVGLCPTCGGCDEHCSCDIDDDDLLGLERY